MTVILLLIIIKLKNKYLHHFFWPQQNEKKNLEAGQSLPGHLVTYTLHTYY